MVGCVRGTSEHLGAEYYARGGGDVEGDMNGETAKVPSFKVIHRLKLHINHHYLDSVFGVGLLEPF